MSSIPVKIILLLVTKLNFLEGFRELKLIEVLKFRVTYRSDGPETGVVYEPFSPLERPTPYDVFPDVRHVVPVLFRGTDTGNLGVTCPNFRLRKLGRTEDGDNV